MHFIYLTIKFSCLKSNFNCLKLDFSCLNLLLIRCRWAYVPLSIYPPPQYRCSLRPTVPPYVHAGRSTTPRTAWVGTGTASDSPAQPERSTWTKMDASRAATPTTCRTVRGAPQTHLGCQKKRDRIIFFLRGRRGTSEGI